MHNSSYTMKNLSVSERPYELLEQRGAHQLTDAQLLAIVLQNGTRDENALSLANRMLSETGSCSQDPLSCLFSLPMHCLKEFKGVGRVKALQIIAIKELSNRLSAPKSDKEQIIVHPSDVADLFMEEMRALKQEIVKVVYLNTKNRLLFSRDISRGSVNKSVVSPREVFIPALEQGAARIILMHNHPSGVPEPSDADISMTQRMSSCGELLEISVLDHIIIGNHKYYSLKEQGLM